MGSPAPQVKCVPSSVRGRATTRRGGGPRAVAGSNGSSKALGALCGRCCHAPDDRCKAPDGGKKVWAVQVAKHKRRGNPPRWGGPKQQGGDALESRTATRQPRIHAWKQDAGRLGVSRTFFPALARRPRGNRPASAGHGEWVTPHPRSHYQSRPPDPCCILAVPPVFCMTGAGPTSPWPGREGVLGRGLADMAGPGAKLAGRRPGGVPRTGQRVLSLSCCWKSGGRSMPEAVCSLGPAPAASGQRGVWRGPPASWLPLHCTAWGSPRASPSSVDSARAREQGDHLVRRKVPACTLTYRRCRHRMSWKGGGWRRGGEGGAGSVYTSVVAMRPSPHQRVRCTEWVDKTQHNSRPPKAWRPRGCMAWEVARRLVRRAAAHDGSSSTPRRGKARLQQRAADMPALPTRPPRRGRIPRHLPPLPHPARKKWAVCHAPLRKAPWTRGNHTTRSHGAPVERGSRQPRERLAPSPLRRPRQRPSPVRRVSPWPPPPPAPTAGGGSAALTPPPARPFPLPRAGHHPPRHRRHCRRPPARAHTFTRQPVPAARDRGGAAYGALLLPPQSVPGGDRDAGAVAAWAGAAGT